MGIQQKIKASIRDAIASALSIARLTNFSNLPTSSLVILTFHRVLPADLRVEYPLPGLAVTPEELKWVINIVKKYFDINTLSVAYEKSLRTNNKRPQLAITFDDGQWDNLEYGLPVLTAAGVPATFYIPTAFIGGEQLLWHDEAAFAWQQLSERREAVFSEICDSQLPEQTLTSVAGFLKYLKQLSAIKRNQFVAQLKLNEIEFPHWSRLMNWNEIIQLHQQNHEIGSHARTHNLLSQLSADEQRQELSQSMLDISEAIGASCRSLCYPDGNYNQETLRLLSNSQYETAVTTKWGANSSESDRFQLQRFDISSKHLYNTKDTLSQSRFQFRLSKYHPAI